MEHKELRQALTKFRELFMKRLLPPSVIAGKEDFLHRMRISQKWSISDAFKLYNILKPYQAELNKVGFDFSTVPPVKMNTVQPTRRLKWKDKKLIGYNKEQFVVYFPYNKDLYKAVKSIPGAAWDPENKYWTVPLSKNDELKKLSKEYDFIVTDKGSAMLNRIDSNLEASYNADEVELDVPLKLKPYPFQSAGIDYGMKNKKIINGDEMGLGKTPQAIGVVMGLDAFPCLVICPKSLRLNWRNEWGKFSNHKPMFITKKNIKSMQNYYELGVADVFITNYEGARTMFTKHIQEIEITKGKRAGKTNKKVHTFGYEKMFKSVILDEAHECRNRSTLRFKTIKPLFEGKDVRLLLTGSPIVKGPADLAALLELAGRIDEFGGYFSFIKKYHKANGKHVFNSKNQPTNLKDLNVKLRSMCFIRREKFQVLKELPDKMRQVIMVDIDNRQEYNQAMRDLAGYMKSKNIDPAKIDAAQRAELLVKIGILKQLAAKGKLSAFKEFVQEVIDSGEKLVVFCWHKKIVKYVQENFKNVLTISGDDSDDEVEKNKQLFQNDPRYPIIISTYKRGGVGHTLTAASKWAAIELGWTYKDQSQAEDRCHRIGQKNSVNCYYFLGTNTIDEKIYEIIDKRRLIEKEATGSQTEIKTTILNDLLGGIDYENFTTEPQVQDVE